MTIDAQHVTKNAAQATSADGQVDFGQAVRVVRVGHSSHKFAFSDVLYLRYIFVCSILATLCACALVVALCVGDYSVSPAQVVMALRGQADDLTHLVVVTWRVPRAIAAITLGAALATSGAIFQSLTRNPLGSPDIIGFSSGAFTGATLALLFFGSGFLLTAGSAFCGGILTALAVYALAYSGGTVGSFRLIVVGIAVSAMLSSVTTALMVNAEVEDAIQVAIWGAGSLKALTYEQVIPASILILSGLVMVGFVGNRLRILELGDEVTQTLGLRLGGTKLFLIGLGVLLAAVSAAVAGPISFIALAAPQLARRLTRSDGMPLVPSALLGALLLQLSDILAENVYPPSPLPVGVITVCIGGGYFMFLLIQEAKRS